VYDWLGRLTSETHPESATTSYTYNANGNVATRTDARGVVVTSGYDALNRVTSRTYSDGTPSATFGYDEASGSLIGLIANGNGRQTSAWTSENCGHPSLFLFANRFLIVRIGNEGATTSVRFAFFEIAVISKSQDTHYLVLHPLEKTEKTGKSHSSTYFPSGLRPSRLFPKSMNTRLRCSSQSRSSTERRHDASPVPSGLCSAFIRHPFARSCGLRHSFTQEDGRPDGNGRGRDETAGQREPALVPHCCRCRCRDRKTQDTNCRETQANRRQQRTEARGWAPG